VKEMDEFFIKKLHKKLRYWGFLHLPLAGKPVVVNSILGKVKKGCEKMQNHA
jgi:hypothetical protein